MKLDINCNEFKTVPKGGVKALCNCHKKNKKLSKWLKGQVKQERLLAKYSKP